MKYRFTLPGWENSVIDEEYFTYYEEQIKSNIELFNIDKSMVIEDDYYNEHIIRYAENYAEFLNSSVNLHLIMIQKEKIDIAIHGANYSPLDHEFVQY